MKPQIKSKINDWLLMCCNKAVAAVNVVSGGNTYVVKLSAEYEFKIHNQSGLFVGLEKFFDDNKSFGRKWTDLVGVALPTATFADAFMFSLQLCKTGYGLTRMGSKSKQLALGFRAHLITALSVLFNSYVIHVFGGGAASSSLFTSLPPPLRMEKKKRSMPLDPELAWTILARSRAKGVSIRKVTEIKKDEEYCDGVQASQGLLWLRRDCIQYLNKQQRIADGQLQVAMSVDPALYGGDDTMVGVGWFWRLKVSSVLCNQVIKAHHRPTLEGVPHYHRHIRTLLKRKIERWDSYKNLAALSHMLFQWIQRPLHSMVLPAETFCVRCREKHEVSSFTLKTYV